MKSCVIVCVLGNLWFVQAIDFHVLVSTTQTINFHFSIALFLVSVLALHSF